MNKCTTADHCSVTGWESSWLMSVFGFALYSPLSYPAPHSTITKAHCGLSLLKTDRSSDWDDPSASQWSFWHRHTVRFWIARHCGPFPYPCLSPCQLFRLLLTIYEEIHTTKYLSWQPAINYFCSQIYPLSPCLYWRANIPMHWSKWWEVLANALE